MQTYGLNVRAKSIKFVTTMIDVYLLLGSNLGDRKFFLSEAAGSIADKVGKVIKSSSIYETASWGKQDAPDYLNQVLLINTRLAPEVVLEVILSIEKDLGRERKEKYGSRTIDIDILFYGNHIIDGIDLKIPHPELHHRRFTLAPLAEIAADLMHPVLKKTIMELKTELKDNLIEKII